MRKFVMLFRSGLLLLICVVIGAAAIAQTVSPELFNGLKWRLIGPFRGGRVVAVSGVPGDSTTFYFGSVNGGVWKTTDAGVVWTPVTDGYGIASIGALAVAPSDPNVIYAGTGESDIRSDLSSGTGVYKSTDAGRTWIHIGLDETRQISKIVVDPRDANVVYVGALGHAYAPNPERGVFKSTDGGAHWENVLDQGTDIGVADLAICAGNPDLLFATTWHTWRAPWYTYPTDDGPGSGLYRSQDAGKTWTRLTGNGLPSGDWGRSGVGVASGGKRVYTLIAGKDGGAGLSFGQLSPRLSPGLYRSDDGGNTWVLANSDSRLTSRAWYFSRITVDPNHADVIYIPNIALYGSEDGGKTISVVRGAPGGDDYHELWINPKNSSSMVLGTDQGTTVSLDRGRTWSSWYNQPTAQMYHVITDDAFPYVVYGTQQDSGSAAVPHRTDHGQITPRDWFPSGGSESGYIALDPDDPNIVYLSGAGGTVSRYDRRIAFSQDVSPWPLFIWTQENNERKYRGPWTPALVRSAAEHNAIFLGTQYVMKTNDGGLHWEAISPDLTGAEQQVISQGPTTLENAKQRGFGVVYAIAPSPLNRDVIWAGSDTGLIHITRDGGKSWTNITPPGLSDWSRISMIEVSHFDAAVAYAAVDRSIRDDRTPYVYRTRDYGKTWQLITTGLLAPAFVRAVREDPTTRGLLFAGTEFGVYVSFDDGDHWQSLQLNLPVTGVRDVAIHGDDLVAATYGRSFWILDNMSPLRQTADAAKSAAWLYKPATAVRIDNDGFTGTPLPPEEPTADNPPNGAMLDYWLKSPAQKILLEIFDSQKYLSQQHLVWKFSSDAKPAKHDPLPLAARWFPKEQVLEKTPGMHRFAWGLRWANSGSDLDDEDASPAPAGPKVIAGNYEVRLTIDGKSYMQPLSVIMDPRSPTTAQVLTEQLRLGKQIFDDAMKTRGVMAQIRSVQKQIGGLQAKAEENSSLKTALTAAQEALSKILKGKGTASSMGTGLEGAYPGLTQALRVVEGGDRAAPSQAMELYKQSSAQSAAAIREWDEFRHGALAAFNQQLKAAGLAAISVSKADEEN